MEDALALHPVVERAPLAPASLPALLPKLWRDPHKVDPSELRAIIHQLETACAAHPDSADLKTCLGMAHAVNLDAYASMDALEEARFLDPQNFWAQLKYAELLYRLRALPKSEEETERALELAGDARQIALARGQLQEIRRLIREGTQKPAWVKPLTKPAVLFSAAVVAISLMMVLR